MAIIGAILGDIIGSQYEFPMMRPERLDWQRCELFTNKCAFTDDTVMTIATKYALDSKTNFAVAYKFFGLTYPMLSYGSSFYEWINDDFLALPYNSYGNGSAMRVSPVIDYAITNSIKTADVAIMAQDTAICTHNHVEGIKGAVVTAICGFMGATGANKSEIYEYANEIYKVTEYRFPVASSLKSLQENYNWSDTCPDTVPVAIRCFLDSEDYESCMRNCLSLHCDMDTMCCIAGAIAESYYGKTGFDNEAILTKYLNDTLLNILKGEL